ncbi:MLO-like protein 14, partial [Mucuna pruriens]
MVCPKGCPKNLGAIQMTQVSSKDSRCIHKRLKTPTSKCVQRSNMHPKGQKQVGEYGRMRLTWIHTNIHFLWIDHSCVATEIKRHLPMQSQSTLVMFHRSNPLVRNTFLTWVTCFVQQFWNSVVRTDYLTLRKGFIMNHNLTLKYDFHNYMIQSMEEEFQKIVGMSVPLWGFVVAFMLFNIKGSNLYFWIAFIPNFLALLVGTKLQHVIATLVLENAEITDFFSRAKLTPRDELFWFNKPELLLSFIHFIIFQNAFELASFFWSWWQLGYNSCFIKNHLVVYLKLILGFVGQFLCSYSTLPLYALVTQMGTNYKAALVPNNIRETIVDWGKATRRKRKHNIFTDNFDLQPLRRASPTK